MMASLKLGVTLVLVCAVAGVLSGPPDDKNVKLREAGGGGAGYGGGAGAGRRRFNPYRSTYF